MTIAYLYSRFSTPAQATGDSLRRQLAAGQAYADQHGLILDTTLRDLGVSAYTGANAERGALRAFKDRVESGEITPGSVLLLDSMDRLSRAEVTIATAQLLEIALAGITVVTLSNGQSFDRKAKTTDLMIAVMEIERSHRESEEKGRKVREAHAESKRRARDEGRVWHRAGPHWLQSTVTGSRRERLITFGPIPERVAVVQRLFDMRESGFGTTAIAARLSSEGVLTPKGGQGWHHSTVLQILKNPAVIGVYTPRIVPKGFRGSNRPADGLPIPNYYPAIINPAQFYRVQALIAELTPETRQPNRRQVSNLFAGVVRCDTCGGAMGIHVSNAGRTTVLRCYAAGRGLCKNRVRYPYAAVERAILIHVADFDLTPKAPLASEAQRALSDAMGRLAELDHELKNLGAEIAKRGGHERLSQMYDDREAAYDAVNASLPALQSAASAAAHPIDPETHRAAIQTLFAAMGEQTGEELFRTRTRLAQAIRDVVTAISFSPEETMTMVLGAAEKPATITTPPRFVVEVMGGLSTYLFRLTPARAFDLIWGAPAQPHVLESPRYRRRFVGDDPVKEAKARRVLRNLAVAD